MEPNRPPWLSTEVTISFILWVLVHSDDREASYAVSFKLGVVVAKESI